MAVFHVVPGMGTANLHITEGILHPELRFRWHRDVVIDRVGILVPHAEHHRIVRGSNGANHDSVRVLVHFDLDAFGKFFSLGLRPRLRTDGGGNDRFAGVFAVNPDFSKFVFDAQRLAGGQGEGFLKLPGRGVLPRISGCRRQDQGAGNQQCRPVFPQRSARAEKTHRFVSRTSCRVCCFSWYIARSW